MDSIKPSREVLRAMRHPHLEDWPPWRVARSTSSRVSRVSAGDVKLARKLKGLPDYEHKPQPVQKKEPTKNEISQLIAGWGR